jgi:hypothetical protein
MSSSVLAEPLRPQSLAWLATRTVESANCTANSLASYLAALIASRESRAK